MKTAAIAIKPLRPNCRYWAKIIRASEPLPLPSTVLSAAMLPGPFLPRGVDELTPGDFFFEGEANSPRGEGHGWTFKLAYVHPKTGLFEVHSPAGDVRPILRERMNDQTIRLLLGSGEIASMVRRAHCVRMGLV